MATSTTNLGLTKPSVNDAADIGVLNSNFDKIDTKCNPALFAPSGYGLGGAVYTADLNKAIKPGWYYTDSKTVNTGRYYTIVHVKAYRNEQFVEQVQTDMNLTNFDRLHRYSKDGGATWTEEWENPLMQLGVEYRTTEKWGGNTVYAKCVSGGSWLDQKTINIPVDNCYRVTRFEAVAGDYCLPFIHNKNLNGNYTAYVRVSRTSTSNIEVKMCGGLDGNAGTYATVVTVFYAKNE